jgi:tRNA nucleotidyltransferase (CCA-adding enzyme)
VQFYPSGESICCELLELPQDKLEWIITGADADDIVAAGFQRQLSDGTRFIHPESGDLYQLARRQHVDKESGMLCFQTGRWVSVEDELATRTLTILAMARNGTSIIDPFGGRQDLTEGVLRHVTPHFSSTPENLLTVAAWSARLAGWGFSVAHGTHALMKKMVAAGAVEHISRHQITDAVLRAMATSRPSAFFRVLHRCGALQLISAELDALYEHCARGVSGKSRHSVMSSLPEVMKILDQVAAETDNVSTVLKKFHAVLGSNAEKVFFSLGFDALYDQAFSPGREARKDS